MTTDEPTSQMSSDEAWALMRQQQAARAAKLEEAKRKAASEGKEPFDLDRFEQLYTDPDAGSKYRVPREERIGPLEKEYYIGRGRRTRTLQEFADIMRYHDDHDWT